jgi:hypothetical protein
MAGGLQTRVLWLASFLKAQRHDEASSQSASQDTTARAADAVNNCEKASNGRPVTAGDFCSFMMSVQRIVHAVKPSAPITSLSQQMCTVEKRSVILAWRMSTWTGVHRREGI